MPQRTEIVDSAKSFEEALSKPRDDHYLLRLYVAGNTPRSVQAVANIRAICEETLPGRYDLEVIDIYQQPEYAKPQQIVVAPTLIKELPLPVRKVIGNLSNRERVLVGLDIIRRPITG